MDPPTVEPSAKEGLINVRDFTVKGEASLDRLAAGGPAGAQNGVAFSRLRAEFTRQNGQLTIREGVVKGPTIGATIEGSIDYPGNQVRMSGTFVPMYGLNNMFGQIPIVGLFLGGGSNEGLIGVTYEVVGTPGAAGASRQSDLGDGARGAPEDLRIQHRQAEHPDRVSAEQLIKLASPAAPARPGTGSSRGPRPPARTRSADYSCGLRSWIRPPPQEPNADPSPLPIEIVP